MCKCVYMCIKPAIYVYTYTSMIRLSEKILCLVTKRYKVSVTITRFGVPRRSSPTTVSSLSPKILRDYVRSTISSTIILLCTTHRARARPKPRTRPWLGSQKRLQNATMSLIGQRNLHNIFRPTTRPLKHLLGKGPLSLTYVMDVVVPWRFLSCLYEFSWMVTLTSIRREM